MKAFVNSLSLGSGAILIALLSVAVVWLLCSVVPALRSLWAVIVPFILAYCLYWLPVWLGAEASGFGAWAILFVGAWFFAGFFPSAVVVLILQKRERRIL
jgi:amino acid permease